MLFEGEVKDEVRRKAFPVALDLLVEDLYGLAIKLGNISVQDDPLAAKKQDARLHGKGGSFRAFRHPEQQCFL